MKPNKFNRMMNAEIDNALDSNEFRPPHPLRREMLRVWDKWAKRENDFRSGSDTYGYESRDAISSNIAYISDRWRCAFRLKWLIDMPTQEAE